MAQLVGTVIADGDGRELELFVAEIQLYVGAVGQIILQGYEEQVEEERERKENQQGPEDEHPVVVRQHHVRDPVVAGVTAPLLDGVLESLEPGFAPNLGLPLSQQFHIRNGRQHIRVLLQLVQGLKSIN